MKLKYLVLATAVVLAFIAACLAFTTKQANSRNEQQDSKIEKLQWQLNTIGVAERVEVSQYENYDPCGLVVVECPNEKYNLKLQ